MVMKRINDRDETANKAEETTETERTSKPGSERLAEVAVTDAGGTERAAAEREMMSSLQRATQAAARLKALSPEEGETEPPTGRDEEPPTGPPITTPLPPPFAVASDGRILLNIEACPDLNLAGRVLFLATVLSDEEAAFTKRKLEDVVHDVAGQLGGQIKKNEPGQGSGGNG
jgi:hypothetical protein